MSGTPDSSIENSDEATRYIHNRTSRTAIPDLHRENLNRPNGFGDKTDPFL
jgi:hypothetical protein